MLAAGKRLLKIYKPLKSMDLLPSPAGSRARLTNRVLLARIHGARHLISGLNPNPEPSRFLSTGSANRDVHQIANRAIAAFSFQTTLALHIDSSIALDFTEQAPPAGA